MHTYLLDTNVLLDDPNAISSFGDNHIILPLVVVEEMDRFKDRPGELGANAREFSRYLGSFISDGVSDLASGVNTPHGGTLRVITLSDLGNIEGDLEKVYPELSDYKGGDNRILQVLFKLTNHAKANKTDLPVLVTRDIQLRVKCNVLGLKSEDRKKGGLAKRTRELYKGYRDVKLTWDAVSKVFKQGNGDAGVVDLAAIVAEAEGETHIPLSPHEVVNLLSPDGTRVAHNATYRNKKPSATMVYPVVVPKIHKLNPRNQEQKAALDLLLDPEVKLVTIMGKAGTGKTLIALAAGLEMVLEQKQYKTLFVCRPIQPVGRDIGYLPGAKDEKLSPWLAPIKDNLKYLLSTHEKSVLDKLNSSNTKKKEHHRYGDDGNQMYGSPDKKLAGENMSTFDYLIERGIIEIEAMTYIRGRSIANAFMLIDESQNMSEHELKTILTRVGENTKIVLTGDVEQIDALHLDSVSNGLAVCVEKFKDVPIAGHLTLQRGVRSELATISSEILG